MTFLFVSIWRFVCSRNKNNRKTFNGLQSNATPQCVAKIKNWCVLLDFVFLPFIISAECIRDALIHTFVMLAHNCYVLTNTNSYSAKCCSYANVYMYVFGAYLCQWMNWCFRNWMENKNKNSTYLEPVLRYWCVDQSSVGCWWMIVCNNQRYLSTHFGIQNIKCDKSACETTV